MTVMKTLDKPSITTMTINFPARKHFGNFSERQLVSKLKKRITQAKEKAHLAAIKGDFSLRDDITHAVSRASNTLRNIIDGKVQASEVRSQLEGAIKLLEMELSTDISSP